MKQGKVSNISYNSNRDDKFAIHSSQQLIILLKILTDLLVGLNIKQETLQTYSYLVCGDRKRNPATNILTDGLAEAIKLQLDRLVPVTFHRCDLLKPPQNTLSPRDHLSSMCSKHTIYQTIWEKHGTSIDRINFTVQVVGCVPGGN
jgi:hypothetical protein